MAKIIARIPSKTIYTPYESIRCTECGCGRGISENGIENEWSNETRGSAGMKCEDYYKNSNCGGTMLLEKGKYVSKQRSYTLVQCDCGEEVECNNFTNTCICGLEYNLSGQQLAHREQWGEDTGEHWSDCI